MPPDANCLLSIADHCLRSRNYLNLIVIDKQPQLQVLDTDAAIEHGTNGASIWHRASNDNGDEPDVVLGAAGDIPTHETVAAAWYLRRHVPDLRVRVVNVVDLMRLFPVAYPHGTTEAQFVELFTADTPVVVDVRRAVCHGTPAIGLWSEGGASWKSWKPAWRALTTKQLRTSVYVSERERVTRIELA